MEARMHLCALLGCVLLATITDASPAKSAPTCGYDSCPVPDPDMLNVHIISHTHLDVGWLKTVDQLYYGSESFIQRAGVQYILDSVVGSLLKDPNRRFIQVETAFFMQWWDNQSNTTQDAVRELVQQGRLEFIGGGWCMNDEGGAHYNAIVDQMTFGLRKLSDLFGPCGVPRVAWQIDPFGHSREQASLFAQMGFDGLFLGRIDYADKDERRKMKTMEMVWNASANLGDKAHLFTGVLFNTYSPPNGFCFDLLCSDQPIIDNPKSRDYNVDKKVGAFSALMEQQALSYATNNVAVTMGNDFNYQAADSWFVNLDRLIKHTNALQASGGKVNVFYSTPSCYLNALHKSTKKQWPTKSDDFMPYASDPHAYWTGYFTSRPGLKGYIRQNNNLLQACKQLDLLAAFSDTTDRLEKVNVLKESMAIAQHHDAVSGTAKQQVTDDYMERLYDGAINCQSAMDDTYQILLSRGSALPPLQNFCNKLNVSECHVSENEDGFTVTVYNPFSQQVTTPVRLPTTKTDYVVTGPNFENIDFKIVPLPRAIIDLPERNSVSTWELVFMATVPPLGFYTYFVNANTEQIGNHALFVKSSSKRNSQKADVFIQNENFKVEVDGDTGLLKKVINLKDMVSVPVKQDFLYYRGMAGNNFGPDDRASGAYIFRNNGTATAVSTRATVQTYKSAIVQEIHQRFNSWVSQVIRLYANSEHVEFDWIIGPIPVDDGTGKEVVTRFKAKNMNTDSVFYTDSNGREMLERKIDYRPTWQLNVSEPVSGNYYPINSRIYVQDKIQNVQMTLLTDRSVGGTNLKPYGSLELMLHRRLLHDDSFGVGEALNEPGSDGNGLIVRGKTFLHIGPIATSAAAHRLKGLQLLLSPQLSFAVPNMQPDQYKNTFRTTYSALRSQLPENVHILTFERINQNQAILRLEHFYELGEDSKLSQPAIVDIPNLFSNFTITSMQEMTLGANQLLKDNNRLKWSIESNDISQFTMKRAASEQTSDEPTQIRLEPMEIRTFIITFEQPSQEF